jgi:hypothetical protein
MLLSKVLVITVAVFALLASMSAMNRSKTPSEVLFVFVYQPVFFFSILIILNQIFV